MWQNPRLMELRTRSVLIAAAFYTALSVAMLSAVVRHPATTVPMDAGDPVLVAAVLQWNATTLPLSGDWWNFPAFAPAKGTTTFTEHLLGLWPIASPIIWVTGNPLLAYNAAFLLSFPLNATAMFLLAYALTRSLPGALVAGVAFAFAPYRGNQLSHLQMLMSFGMPLALLGLHQYVASGRRRGLVWCAAGWLCAVLSNSYMLVFFGIFVGCWVLWFCSTREHVRRVPALLLAGMLATLPIVPIAAMYLEVHSRYRFTRPLSEITLYSAGVTGVFHPSPGVVVSSAWLTPLQAEGAIFPGLTISLLALVGIAWRLRRSSPAAPPNALDRVLVVVAAVCLAAVAVAAVTDIRFSVLGQRVSLTSIDRPLMVAVVALTVWAWRKRTHLRSLFRFSNNRGVVAFYGCTAVLMWLFSLGPAGRLPYSWLLHVPGVTGIRAPARFWILAVLSLSVLAAFGVTRLGRGRAPWVVAIVASAAIVIEGWVRVPAVPVHPFPFVQPDFVDAMVLELPVDSPEANIAAVLRATTGGYRTLNGYSGYEAPHFAPMRAGLRLRDTGIITTIRQRTDLYVSVLSNNADGWRAWLADTYSGAIRLVGESPERALYKLPKLEYTPPVVGGAVPFTVQHASCGAASARFVMDASLDTRWECGGATLGQQIVLDAGAVTRLSAVAPALGPYATDAPRELRVETSVDRATWKTVWSGPIWAAAMTGGWEDEARIAALIPFPPVSARYVRLTQIGGDSGFFWSVAELQILE